MISNPYDLRFNNDGVVLQYEARNLPEEEDGAGTPISVLRQVTKQWMVTQPTDFNTPAYQN